MKQRAGTKGVLPIFILTSNCVSMEISRTRTPLALAFHTKLIQTKVGGFSTLGCAQNIPSVPLSLLLLSFASLNIFFQLFSTPAQIFYFNDLTDNLDTQ